jgi:hypothetical protein
VHGAVQAANSTIDAPSDLALDLVFTGGAIGNHTASYPEIPVPPEHNDMRLCTAPRADPPRSAA